MIKTGIANYKAYAAKEQLSVSAVLLTVVVFLILLSASVFGKNIVIDIDGEKTELFVFNSTVADVIDTYNIDFCKYDEISALPESKLYNNQTLTIAKAFEVDFELNGERKRIYTTKTTVNDFLYENKLSVGEYDVLSLPLTARLSSGSYLSLQTAEVTYETVTEVIPFKTVLVPDYSSQAGESKITNEGKDGLREVCYKVVKRNNEVISKQVAEQTILEEPVNQVKKYGTVAVKLASRDAGASFRYKNVIPMTATAYDLSYESCGKHPGQPGYGITASGMRARRGVVAVDTSVIPLGTRLYIESTDGSFTYGYAIAGDRGGAIRGNKIDLFMDTRSECLQFGRRSVNVYILE